MPDGQRPPPAPPRKPNWFDDFLRGKLERSRDAYIPPTIPTGLDPQVQGIMARPEFKERWGYSTVGQVPEWQELQRGLETVTDLPPPDDKDLDEPIPPPSGTMTFTDAQGRVMTWNGMNQYVQTGYDPSGIPPSEMTPFQEAQVERWERQDKPEAERKGKTWEQMMKEKEAIRITGERRREQERWEADQERQAQQFEQTMAWNREQAQMRAAEQERQQMARFAAMGPISWMQAAAYTGETPETQEFMRPLMPGLYGGQGATPQGGAAQPSGFQTGQPISGWTPESGAGMQELLRPSAQLWARMGPTSQAQLMSYRQARTGIRPEEQEFRRRSVAPPGGMQGGLRWSR